MDSNEAKIGAVRRTEGGVEVFAPAKLNLFLAITGRRADGFHDLVSVATTLHWGDTLRAEPAAEFSLVCDDPTVPMDESNLVLKAARGFADATGWTGGAKFFLGKRVPMGAGLGGGSSDAVAALRALNALAGAELAASELAAIAGKLGSDCPLFLHEGPVVMRGRGEKLEKMHSSGAARLRGRRVLVFKPAFGISTPWAYGQLAKAAPESYLVANEAEARLAAWLADPHAGVEQLLFNNMEPPAFGKYVALPALLNRLGVEFGLAPRMSGSGSACFALLDGTVSVPAVIDRIRDAWGPTSFVLETSTA